MKHPTEVIVSVEFRAATSSLARAEVIIDLTETRTIDSSKLIDACQRAVANCIDVLEKDLDKR